MQSALLLPVPAAEAAVGAHRARLDASARDGVPAHITVLYPFLPPAEIGPEVLAELARLFAAVPRFSFTLDQVRWFGESVVWLGPSDESPFRALTGLAVAAYPSCPPYRGAHEDVVPHLTIGHLGDPAELRAGGRGGPPAAADRDAGDRGDPDGRTGSAAATRPLAHGGLLPARVSAGTERSRHAGKPVCLATPLTASSANNGRAIAVDTGRIRPSISVEITGASLANPRRCPKFTHQ